MEREEGLKRLREPFDPSEIGKLPKPYKSDSAKGKCRECDGYHGLPAAHLDFVGHAALTGRLLEVDPEWSWEPFAVDASGLPAFDRNGGLWIKLTICGVTRPGYGDAGGKNGGNAIKEAIGDALRNGGMRFGAALDLWHKGDLHAVSDEQNSRTEPSAPAAPPVETVPDEVADDWAGELDSAGDIAQLQALWEQAGKAGVTHHPNVIAAKDKRKGELTRG